MAKSRSFFDDATLSDVTIKFSGQQIYAHKVTLSKKCEYFFKAFTGGFPIACSKEVDLGDEDNPDAIRAMVKHLYDLPYNKHEAANNNKDKSNKAKETDANSETGNENENLIFYIKVFTAADKYDVPDLRKLVVRKFKDLMNVTWQSEQFATAMKALCLPSAPDLADASLKTAGATFCAGNIGRLIQQPAFKAVLEEEEPFAGRMLVRCVTVEIGAATIYQCNGRDCKRLLQHTEIEDNPKSCPSCENPTLPNPFDSVKDWAAARFFAQHSEKYYSVFGEVFHTKDLGCTL